MRDTFCFVHFGAITYCAAMNILITVFWATVCTHMLDMYQGVESVY